MSKETATGPKDQAARTRDRFSAEGDFQDDEVALLHEPAAPYRPVSEPLVHLRAAIDHLVASGVVTPSAAQALVADLKGRWYGERTLQRAKHALKGSEGADAAGVTRELSDFDRFRLKTIDLERFLVDRPFAIST